MGHLKANPHYVSESVGMHSVKNKFLTLLTLEQNRLLLRKLTSSLNIFSEDSIRKVA